MYTINCNGKILNLRKTIVMGIINATPDSFYEGHLQQGIGAIVDRVGTMLKDGAGIIDIGGQSSRPGSEKISPGEEIARVIPVIKAIHTKHPGVCISIDTFYSQVAREAVLAGACIVNDISSGNLDPDMIPTVASLRVPYIVMHMKGSPQDMHLHTHYENLLAEIMDYFISKINQCRQAGIKDVIIDPGFGFAKTIDQNFLLLKYLDIFKILRLPLLAGLSRKSTIYKTLGINVKESLNGTTAMNSFALMQGANILRVHEVKEASQTIVLLEKMMDK